MWTPLTSKDRGEWSKQKQTKWMHLCRPRDDKENCDNELRIKGSKHRLNYIKKSVEICFLSLIDIVSHKTNNLSF